MIIVIAGGVTIEHGIVFKSAQVIETADKVSHIVFDKTETLTNEKPSIAIEEYFFSESRLLNQSIVLELVSNSKHSVSSVITSHLKEQNVIFAIFDDVKSIIGMGLEGVYGEIAVRDGSPQWLNVEVYPIVQKDSCKRPCNFLRHR